MFCKNCGSQNTDAAVFCAACGASLKKEIASRKKYIRVIIVISLLLVIAICVAIVGWFKNNPSSKINSAYSTDTIQTNEDSLTTQYVSLDDLEKSIFKTLQEKDITILEPYFIPNVRQAMANSSVLEEVGEFLFSASFWDDCIIPEPIYTCFAEELIDLKAVDSELENTIIKECNQYYASQNVEFQIENIYIIEFDINQYSMSWLATETAYGWQIISIYD